MSWDDPIIYRQEAIDELLLRPQAAPQRRHVLDDDPYSYTELQREPRPEVLQTGRQPMHPRDFRVRKVCLGQWRTVTKPEIGLLYLASEQDQRGVVQLLGQEFRRAPDDSMAETFFMAYSGLDLEQWIAVCRKQSPLHFHPFGDAAFWLRLVHNVLDKALYPFHVEGFVHCDFKPDNLCIPFTEVQQEADGDITGYMELDKVALIDLGASVGPVGADQKRLNTGCVVMVGEDRNSPMRYVSDYYEQHRNAHLDVLDGRADLYSMAYWLRSMLLADAPGDGPWAEAALCTEIVTGTPAQRALLRDLPGLLWKAAEQYGESRWPSHPALAARIREVEYRGNDRVKFRVPAQLSHAEGHHRPSWSLMKGYRHDAHGQSSSYALYSHRGTVSPAGGGRSVQMKAAAAATDLAPRLPPPVPSEPDQLGNLHSGGTAVSQPTPTPPPTQAQDTTIPPVMPLSVPSPVAVAGPATRPKSVWPWVIVGATFMLLGLAGIGLALYHHSRVSDSSPPATTAVAAAAAPVPVPDYAAQLARLTQIYLDDGDLQRLRVAFRKEREQGNVFALFPETDVVMNLATSPNTAESYTAALKENGFDESALQLLQSQATAGNADAALLLSDYYGYRKEIPKKLEWLKQASDGSNKVALQWYGVEYLEHGRLPTDEARGYGLIKQSAEAGYTRALESMCIGHEKGLGGLKEDAKQAVQWCTKAAEKGERMAMVRLGDYYRTGSGVPNDVQRALEWYEHGAQAGSTTGMLRLGRLYEEGEKGKLEKDGSRALQWYQQAAEAGNYVAMSKLGEVYERGLLGVEANPVTAGTWFAKVEGLVLEAGAEDEKAGDMKEAFYSYMSALTYKQSKRSADAALRAYRALASTEKLKAEDVVNIGFLARAMEDPGAGNDKNVALELYQAASKLMSFEGLTVPDDLRNSTSLVDQALLVMIPKAESIDLNEKQYWFDIFPSMTDEQKKRLYDILDKERVNLRRLDRSAQTDIKILVSGRG